MPLLGLFLRNQTSSRLSRSAPAQRRGRTLIYAQPEQTRTIGTLRTQAAAAPKKLRQKHDHGTHAVPRRSSSTGTCRGSPAGTGPLQLGPQPPPARPPLSCCLPERCSSTLACAFVSKNRNKTHPANYKLSTQRRAEHRFTHGLSQPLTIKCSFSVHSLSFLSSPLFLSSPQSKGVGPHGVLSGSTPGALAVGLGLAAACCSRSQPAPNTFFPQSKCFSLALRLLSHFLLLPVYSFRAESCLPKHVTPTMTQPDRLHRLMKYKHVHVSKSRLKCVLPHDFGLYLEWLLIYLFFFNAILITKSASKVICTVWRLLTHSSWFHRRKRSLPCRHTSISLTGKEQLQAAASFGTNGSFCVAATCVPDSGVILLLEHRRACNSPVPERVQVPLLSDPRAQPRGARAGAGAPWFAQGCSGSGAQPLPDRTAPAPTQPPAPSGSRMLQTRVPHGRPRAESNGARP